MKHLFTDLDAALFDLDGTLVETNIDFPLMKREMVRLAVDYGVSHSEVEGLDILAVVDRMTDHLRDSRGDTAAEAARDEAFIVLEEIELRHSADAREIRPARELIEALKSREIRVGIVTRNCRVASEESLALAGISADVLISRDEDVRTKPSPDQLLRALGFLGCEPERSVMIGDHTIDVVAGKAAGMRTIGVLTPNRPPDFFDSFEPNAVAADLSEILSAVIDSHS